uniref:Uncharacterized protein n=1 Tax=Oryza meridionalis TaxID=40149 RepID=A0A0E0D3X8_9ORYZ
MAQERPRWRWNGRRAAEAMVERRRTCRASVAARGGDGGGDGAEGERWRGKGAAVGQCRWQEGAEEERRRPWSAVVPRLDEDQGGRGRSAHGHQQSPQRALRRRLGHHAHRRAIRMEPDIAGADAIHRVACSGTPSLGHFVVCPDGRRDAATAVNSPAAMGSHWQREGREEKKKKMILLVGPTSQLVPTLSCGTTDNLPWHATLARGGGLNPFGLVMTPETS